MEQLPHDDRPTEAVQKLAELYPGASILAEDAGYANEEERIRLKKWGFANALLLHPNGEIRTALYVVDGTTSHARAIERIDHDEAKGILPEFSYLTAMTSISQGTFEYDWASYYIGLFESA